MTYTDDCTLPSDLLEQIAEQGFDYLPELIRILVNAAMQMERQKHLAAEPYERSSERQGQANGYKPKTVNTRLGEITFSVPQVREGGFCPHFFARHIPTGVLLQMELATLPGDTAENGFASFLQTAVIITDDQLHTAQASGYQAL